MKITGYPGPDRGCRVTGSDPGIRSEHYYLHGWFGGRDGSILSVSSTISAIPILSVSYRRFSVGFLIYIVIVSVVNETSDIFDNFAYFFSVK